MFKIRFAGHSSATGEFGLCHNLVLFEIDGNHSLFNHIPQLIPTFRRICSWHQCGQIILENITVERVKIGICTYPGGCLAISTDVNDEGFTALCPPEHTRCPFGSIGWCMNQLSHVAHIILGIFQLPVRITKELHTVLTNNANTTCQGHLGSKWRTNQEIDQVTNRSDQADFSTKQFTKSRNRRRCNGAQRSGPHA